MFLIVLLISRTACEWVQIAQQHYRKPLRSHNPLEETTEFYFEETTKTNRIYLNHSIGPHTWHKGNIDKVPKFGNVQRVQLDTNAVKAPNLRVTAIKNIDNSNEEEDQINFKGIGSIDSQEHRNTERPAPNSQKVKNVFTERKTPQIKPENELDRTKNRNIFHKISNNANFANIIPTTKTNQTNISYNRYAAAVASITKNPTSLLTTKNDQTFVDEVINIDNFKDLDNIRIVEANTNRMPFIKNKITPLRTEHNTHNFSINRIDKYTNSNDYSREKIKDVSKAENSFITTYKPKINMQTAGTESYETKADIDQSKENEKIEGEQNSKESSSQTKPNTIDNLMKFVSVVANTIRRNTRHSVTSKTTYLQNLKDSILANIEERIEAAWPDDEGQPRSARTRTRRDSRGHHLEIPSSESALMTISFLTFAVFLIKLVLQLIQTYKNKAMMVTPAVVATVGRAAAPKRRARP